MVVYGEAIRSERPWAAAVPNGFLNCVCGEGRIVGVVCVCGCCLRVLFVYEAYEFSSCWVGSVLKIARAT